MDIFLRQMGSRILARRKEFNLTQEQLAEKTGLTTQTISSAECGRKALRPENIVKISIALNCSTDYLLLGSAIVSDKNLLFERLTPRQRSHLELIIENFIEAVLIE